MTTLTLLDASLRPSLLGADAGEVGGTAVDGGGPTIDELIVGVWEGLSAGHAAACPVCDGALVPRFGSGSAPVAGRCRDCGSELA